MTDEVIHHKVRFSPFQDEFLSRLNDPLVILQTGVGAGKSRALAWWLVIQAVSGLRIIAVAQTYRALTEVIFREIQIICTELNVECTVLEQKKIVKIGDNGGCIYGASGDNPQGILGFTDFAAAVFDEAGYIPRACYDFVSDRLRGEGIGAPMIRCTSSPSGSALVSWFSKLCKENPQCVIRASSLDNPFTSEAYKKSLIARYQFGSAMYRQQVEGEIVDGDVDDTIFRMESLKLALTIPEPLITRNMYTAIGVDCARYGNDRSCVCIRYGYWMGEDIVRIQGGDSYDIADAVEVLYKQAMARRVPVERINVDMAYGSGVIDILRSRGHNNVNEVAFAEKAKDGQYYNARAEMYFRMQKWLYDGGIIRDEELAEEMHAQRYCVHGDQLLKLIGKEVIKETLGRSPDIADAAALTFYGGGAKADLVQVSAERIAEDVTRGRKMVSRFVGRKFATY